MMMECPRCGFAQPKDQFCANCGLNVEHYVAKPKPFIIRVLQNPNLHLSLIGVAVVFVIGYIIYTQSTLVSTQIGHLLDLPVSSRDAGDPDDVSQNSARPQRQTFRSAKDNDDVEAADTSAALAANSAAPADDIESSEGGGAIPPGTGPGAGAAGGKAPPSDAVKLTSSHKLEVTHWEVPREALANLVALAEKLGEGSGGRTYLYPNGQKIAEEIQNVGRRLALGRSIVATSGQQMTIETPPTTAEAFQYGLFFQIAKVENKELALKWESTLVLPQAETAAEAASPNPAVRATTEINLNGNATLTSSSLMVIVMEPGNRSPREEFLARAGEGPWAIFASPEFRAGMTEWVITVALK